MLDSSLKWNQLVCYVSRLDGKEINFNTSGDAIATDTGSINTPALAEFEVASEDTIVEEVMGEEAEAEAAMIDIPSYIYPAFLEALPEELLDYTAET